MDINIYDSMINAWSSYVRFGSSQVNHRAFRLVLASFSCAYWYLILIFVLLAFSLEALGSYWNTSRMVISFVW